MLSIYDKKVFLSVITLAKECLVGGTAFQCVFIYLDNLINLN